MTPTAPVAVIAVARGVYVVVLVVAAVPPIAIHPFEEIDIFVTAVPLKTKEGIVIKAETLSSQAVVDTTVPPVISVYVAELVV
jgi:hypothetical protein